MPIDQVAIVRMCGGCRDEIETITVKKDNMRLFVDDKVWCEGCQSEQPEVRDIAGRLETIQTEQQNYPVSPTSGPPRMERVTAAVASTLHQVLSLVVEFIQSLNAGGIGPVARAYEAMEAEGNLFGVEGNHTLPAGLPPALVRILLARGIDSAEQLQCFLQPPHHLPYSPLRLSGMEAALRRLSRTVNSGLPGMGEKVGIVGDFDVDGITGTAILVEGLADFGIEAVPYLPHRVAEGHGLSTDAVQYLAGQDVGLIVTVDCGVSSAGEVEEAHRLGMDAIITDHHVPPADPPVATAIINPRVPGNEYPFLHLCGAGLAFKLMQGLYHLQGRPAPPGLLELACLGTIADVVPLLDENRYLVKAGLKELGRTQRPGLHALYRLAGLGDKPVTAETVAFQIAPRLNAAGRMGHAVDSLRLLTTRREVRGGKPGGPTGKPEPATAGLDAQGVRRGPGPGERPGDGAGRLSWWKTRTSPPAWPAWWPGGWRRPFSGRP